ncbi:hypothetical protein D915_008204 [Fasciola hepatica]|uniref:Myb-binding protein 1A n=1 Tax=Fasciola hepatica TaxID=6192 RepID=A0A4E0R4I1_FASHE|nr:hypothetical protein D915_008204 [Fasciola hepatica]
MSVDRKFLDLFWSISGENQNEADQAVEKLCNELHNKTGEARKNYFSYTRERVIKGLRSFAAPARSGFSKTLLRFLTKFPSETNNEQLLQLLDKHIYVSSFSKGPEETSVKYAYISILDILHRTDRLAESSSESTALDLLDSAVRHSCLVNLWPALYDAATRVPTAKHITRFLQLVVRVVCSYGNELTTACLSSDVIDLFVIQLADKKHGCFSTASALMSKMLSEVVQCWIKNNGNQVNNKEEQLMAFDQTECLDSPASPDALFRCLISSSQLVDFSVHHSVQKPCQFLLERVPKAFSPTDLVTYARKLMLLFTELKIPPMKQMNDGKVEQIVAAVPNVNAIRGFVANQLHTLLQATTHDADQLFSKITLPVVEFLVTSGLDSLVSPSSPAGGGARVITKDSTACWIALFRFLNSLFPRWTRADGKLSTTSCDLSSLLQHLLGTAHERLTSHQTVVSKEPIQTEILPRLHRAIALLTKLDPNDTLGSSMAQLYSVACLFGLSQPIEEWSQMSNLLDDLKECFKRRAESDKSSDPNALPWSAVLVDVLLGLIAYPSHMLRSLVRLTFEGLIISGEAGADCLELVTDVIRTRLFKGVRGTGTDDERADNNVEGEEEDDLITFRNDFDSEQHAVGNAEENKQSDEDDAENGSQSEPSEDDDPANADSNDDVEESDSDNDSDGEEEEEEIDETQLQAVRDSVRQALGSAVLDEEEPDSLTCHEFTDEEMFARDTALAAAFRANRKTAPDRAAAERARSLGQMKMRCLDLLGCIVQHSVQPELLLPALTVLLDIGRLAAECEMRSKQKQKPNEPSNRQRASFAARYGDLPALGRISDVVKLLTSRTAVMQQDLCARLTSTELLEKAMQSMVTAAQLSHPTPVYTNYLCLIVQFLYRTAQSFTCEPEFLETLSAPLLDQLKLFVTCPRKSPIHGTVFTTLIIQCPPFAKQAADVIFHSLQEFVAKFPNGEKATGAEQFAAMKSMDLLVHVFKWLTNESDPKSARPLRKLPEKVLALLCSTLEPTVSMVSAEAMSNTPWFGSVAFASTLFTLLQWALKAAERMGRPQVVSPDMLLALRQLPSQLKPVRQAARRFVTFTEALKAKNGSLTVDGASRAEKQRLKQERKKARQAKRREKALREQQRREALAEEKNKKHNAGDKSIPRAVSAKTATSEPTRAKKSFTSDSVPLRTNPKPKSIKSARPAVQKRRNVDKNKENKVKRAKTGLF